MNGLKLGIYELLAADTLLCDPESGLLALNANPDSPSEEESRANSIVELRHIDKVKPPFISIALDEDRRTGLVQTDAFVLVRCYNNRDKSFYTINKVLSRVRKLLDGQRLREIEGEGYASVEILYESTRPELPDEGVNLNFRESQYRSRYL